MFELLLVIIVAFFLWYRIILPESYYTIIALFSMLMTIQLIFNRSSAFLIIQIALIFLLIRNIYSLSMNFAIIPFGDGNWDYGVVKTFLQKESVFVIGEPTLLSLYSGWPLLHTFTMVLSSISGLDAFYLALLLPSIISIISFIFVYLLVEKIRKSLKLGNFVTPLALLIYTVSPDSIFWQMQFVRQNIGMLLITIVFYLIAQSISNPTNPKYKALTFFFAFSLVIGHHLTSFVAVVYLFLFSIFSIVGKHLGTRLAKTFFWTQPRIALLGTTLITCSMLFVWWDSVATMVWPYITSGIEHLSKLLTGLREVEYFPRQASYPNLLTPSWATSLLLLRDILIYLPAFFALIIVARETVKKPEKFFLIYSGFAFGLMIVLDNLVFRIGIIRVLTLSLPFLVLLSAISYSYVINWLKSIGKFLVIPTLVLVLLSSSFVGLWGHTFAPFHLYNPTINPAEIGERNKDSMRIVDFQKKVPIKNFDILWTDDRSPMLFLLEPNDYHKISWMSAKDIQEMGSSHAELAYALKDLNLYFYHAGVFSPAGTLEEAETIKNMLQQRLVRFNYVYNDEKNELWITCPFS